MNEVDRGDLSKIEIAKKYDIKKTTLSTHLKNRESIRFEYKKEKAPPFRKPISAYTQLDIGLAMQIMQVCSRNLY